MILSSFIILLVVQSFNAVTCFIQQNTSKGSYYNHSLLQKTSSMIISSKLPSMKNEDNSADNLLKQAEKLRKEVSQFEQKKEKEAKEIRREEAKVAQEKQNEYMRYSAEVPILKGDGSEVMERVQFLPRLKGNKSNIIVVQAALPLGLILGQSEELPGLTTVDDIAEGSNGENAGVKIGDILRACTACQVSMEMPTWQLMAGGIGRPKTSRMMFSTDGKAFEEVMDALVSNQMDPNERPAWLVLERQE